MHCPSLGHASEDRQWICTQLNLACLKHALHLFGTCIGGKEMDFHTAKLRLACLKNVMHHFGTNITFVRWVLVDLHMYIDFCT